MKHLLALLLLATIAKSQNNPRIDNGEIATRNQFNWHVHMEAVGTGAFFSGIFIDPSWVLTCAACANKAETYKLKFGVWNMSNPDESGHVEKTIVNATDVKYHPAYDPAHFNINNIALIKLDEPITTSAYVNPIKLPANGTTDNYLGEYARISGFGSTDEDASKVMRYTDFLVEDDTRCRGVVDPGQMCATVTTPGVGPCEDEGAALVYTDIDGSGIAIGIFSYGFGEGACPGSTALFTRITTYLEWISTTTNITSFYDDYDY